MAEFRVVPDSNAIVAGFLSENPASPNREFLARWQRREFVLLYSADMLTEFMRKLTEVGIAEDIVVNFALRLAAAGHRVMIKSFHAPRYPVDSDDTAFLLCAWNGDATHLVSYDPHLLSLAPDYAGHFRIVPTTEFLAELRAAVSAG